MSGARAPAFRFRSGGRSRAAAGAGRGTGPGSSTSPDEPPVISSTPSSDGSEGGPGGRRPRFSTGSRIVCSGSPGSEVGDTADSSDEGEGEGGGVRLSANWRSSRSCAPGVTAPEEGCSIRIVSSISGEISIGLSVAYRR